MIEATLKKECKNAFDYLLKVMNKDEIKNLSHILNCIKNNDFPAGSSSHKPKIPLKETILPFKEIAGLKVFNGGKN